MPSPSSTTPHSAPPRTGQPRRAPDGPGKALGDGGRAGRRVGAARLAAVVRRLAASCRRWGSALDRRGAAARVVRADLWRDAARSAGRDRAAGAGCRRWGGTTGPGVAAAAAALATLGIVGEAFKRWVGRLAPHALVVGLHAGGMSFPGGHAANVVLSGGLLLSLARSTRAGRRHGRVLLAGWVAVSTAVGVASVLVGFHWVSDVVAGWLLGALLLTLTPPVTTGAGTAEHGASPPGARSDGEGAQGHLPSSPRSGHARRTLTTREGCGSPAVVRPVAEPAGGRPRPTTVMRGILWNWQQSWPGRAFASRTVATRVAAWVATTITGGWTRRLVHRARRDLARRRAGDRHDLSSFSRSGNCCRDPTGALRPLRLDPLGQQPAARPLPPAPVRQGRRPRSSRLVAASHAAAATARVGADRRLGPRNKERSCARRCHARRFSGRG